MAFGLKGDNSAWRIDLSRVDLIKKIEMNDIFAGYLTEK